MPVASVRSRTVIPWEFPPEGAELPLAPPAKTAAVKEPIRIAVKIFLFILVSPGFNKN
jgi:hypothetical protein